MAVASLTEAVFKLPNRSNFRMPFHSQGTYEFGKIYPLQAIEMSPGDKIKINMQSLTRSNALKYPTMANIRCEYHAFFVPLRILAHNFDNVLNLAIDEDKRPAFPIMSFPLYANFLSRIILSSGYNRLKSSLLDQLNYPVFAELYNYIIGSQRFQLNFDEVPILDESSLIDLISFNIDFADYFGISGTSVLENIPTFHSYLRETYEDIYTSFVSSLDDSLLVYDPDVPSVIWCKYSGTTLAASLCDSLGKTTNSLFDEYLSYVIYMVFSSYFRNMSATHGKPINFLSIWSYWRSIYDWYINTNIDENVDTWEEWCVANFGCTIDTFSDFFEAATDPDEQAFFLRFITPAERLFASDYFTAAFLSTQNGAAVPIPSGGTLIDLRSAESEQTFKEKLLFSGKRRIDQIRTLFGVVSSDARFDRAEILGSQKFTIGINSVSQTAPGANLDDALGSYAGQGYASGTRNGFVKFRAEENGLILIFMSYKPEVIYSGVVDRLNLKTSAFDFLLPDFENVGEQGIYQQELAYIPRDGGASDVFGFNRRFAEYMFIHSSVHGAFKTSLAFMTLARRFVGKPALNSEFIRINPEVNGLNDIFVAPEDKEQFNNWSFFEVYCTRPLSRFIEYGF